jgi:hypothetical protein
VRYERSRDISSESADVVLPSWLTRAAHGTIETKRLQDKDMTNSTIHDERHMQRAQVRNTALDNARAQDQVMTEGEEKAPYNPRVST